LFKVLTPVRNRGRRREGGKRCGSYARAYGFRGVDEYGAGKKMIVSKRTASLGVKRHWGDGWAAC